MKKITLGIFALALAFSMSAQAGDDHSAVMDKRGNPVLDMRDNCVRHDWDDGTDVCAPPPPPEPEPVAAPPPPPPPSPARELMADDRTVNFDFDSDKLDAEATAKLDNLAEVLKGSHDVKSAEIVGYADKIGNETYNMNLSKRRAEAVQNYLTSRGYINTSIAETSWFGESNPKVECTGAGQIKCLRANRRVEVKVKFIREVLR